MNTVHRIKGYLYHVEDIAYLSDILREVPLPDLFRALNELLNSSSSDDVAQGDLFIRDIRRAEPENSEFINQLEDAGVPAAYQRNVFRNNYFIRRTSIFTLTISRKWLPDAKLIEALRFLEGNDPFLLPKFVADWMFRTKWKDWTLPNRLLTNPEYLVRWSVLDLLDPILNFPLPESGILSMSKSCLSRLQADSNPLVGAEAAFLLNRVRFFEIMPTLAKTEKRKGSKSIASAAPKIRFESMRMFVEHHLSALNKTDFDFQEIHTLVDNLQSV